MVAMLCFPFVLPSGASAPSCGPWCKQYDVVVIGSEVEGILLAKAAQDEGLQVLVLDPREAPGGQLIQGEMLVLDEPRDKSKNSLVQGEIKRLYDGYNNRKIRKLQSFQKYYAGLTKQLPMRNGIRIESVETTVRNGYESIQSLTYTARDGHAYKVQAKYWVENTDFNALTSHLKVKRIPGVETVFKSKSPDYMAATMILKFKNVNWGQLHDAVLKDYPLTNVAKKYGPNTYVDWNFGTGFSNITAHYKPQDEQLMLRGLNTTYQQNGEVVMNALLIFDVDPSDPESVRSAMDKAMKEAPHVLAFLRKHIPGYSKAELNGFPEYLYIREFNRFETDYVINYKDVMSGRMHWDNVSIGGYPVDLQGTKSSPYGITLGKPDRYGIPLRSFLLKEYDNVLTAGKNVGATAQAYGSVRIMPNTALAGQTIGIILGRERDKPLRSLSATDFERIHEYLKRDYKIKIRG
ncbi:FAD-dependent oxidoreductase [Xylanibacillus composti]|nr:FAD-dependent oxidoreductase [Xylanibacillus composti]